MHSPHRIPEDPSREHRIHMEAVVDCYNEEEAAMGWYYYLQNRITFPLHARCITERSFSPLEVGEHVTATEMAPEEDCLCEMLVEITWHAHDLAVPLAQLEPLHTDPQTTEAIADWHYWTNRGYQLR